MSLGIVGGINHLGAKHPIFENLPILEWKALPDGSWRFREENGSPELGDILEAIPKREDMPKIPLLYLGENCRKQSFRIGCILQKHVARNAVAHLQAGLILHRETSQ
jgi:hypothetical protein